MDLKLAGKVALVTGSSKGIGEGIARGLARENATIVVHGRDRIQTDRVARDIIEAGGRAHAVVGDLTVNDEVRALVSEAEALAGSINILVNNAGGSGPTEDWSNTDPQTWRSVYDRNVLAAVRVTNLILPGMRSAKWGRVINIASLAAMMPIHSAALDTAFLFVATKQGLAEDAPWKTVEEAVLSQFAEVPIGRVGTLEEIADAVAFLVSPRAGYITGTNLRLDGGMLPTA